MHECAIPYSRGRITVLNMARLENKVCDCYGVITQEYDKLLHRTVSFKH